MYRLQATVTATSSETRVLVTDQQGDRLIARLGALSAAHPRALPTLLESLALWSGSPLHVVLYVDETSSWERTGLVDALGFGRDELFFAVEVVPREAGRHRAKRLSGLGSFARERRIGGRR